MNRELIDKYRNINVDYHGWWEDTECSFIADMVEKHITVRDMRFSGFWSQGDGASFTGCIYNVAGFIRVHELVEAYPTVVLFCEKFGDTEMTARIIRTGGYFHETSVTADMPDPYSFRTLLSASTKSDDVRMLAAERWDEALDRELNALEGQITEIVRGYCCELYRRLEAEYNYLTSDEVVWDTIVANELEKETR